MRKGIHPVLHWIDVITVRCDAAGKMLLQACACVQPVLTPFWLRRILTHGLRFRRGGSFRIPMTVRQPRNQLFLQVRDAMNNLRRALVHYTHMHLAYGIGRSTLQGCIIPSPSSRPTRPPTPPGPARRHASHHSIVMLAKIRARLCGTMVVMT